VKLLTFRSEDGPRAGVSDGDRVRPLRAGVAMLDVVRAGLPVDLDRWLADEPTMALADLALLAPLEPPTIRDFVAFEEHVEGVRRSLEHNPGVAPEWYEAPTFYFANPYAVIGSGQDVAIPQGCVDLDFELEVGVVIGRAGSSIRPDDAIGHVFGYTIFNDWSARDLQRREMKVGLGPAKGKDFASTLGPCLVTADDFETRMDDDGYLDLAMAVAVDGVEVGRDLLSNMAWPIADLVAYASRDTWVRPGDVLGTGTCGNGGCLAELWGLRGRQDPPPLEAGSVVTMWVEGIGSITNRIVEGRPAAPVRAAAPRPRTRPATAWGG
jgi:2-keto-4-pentenoate hydratase/2-oxohepta-3-ene-1,7-dioic acid hydratase in catechol pathway